MATSWTACNKWANNSPMLSTPWTRLTKPTKLNMFATVTMQPNPCQNWTNFSWDSLLFLKKLFGILGQWLAKVWGNGELRVKTFQMSPAGKKFSLNDGVNMRNVLIMRITGTTTWWSVWGGRIRGHSVGEVNFGQLCGPAWLLVVVSGCLKRWHLTTKMYSVVCAWVLCSSTDCWHGSPWRLWDHLWLCIDFWLCRCKHLSSCPASQRCQTSLQWVSALFLLYHSISNSKCRQAHHLLQQSCCRWRRESHAGLESLSFFLLLVCQIWWVGRVWTVRVELKQIRPSYDIFNILFLHI